MIKQKREDFALDINKLADEHDYNHPKLPDNKICILCSHKTTLGIMDKIEEIRKNKLK